MSEQRAPLQFRIDPSREAWWREIHAATYPDHRLGWPDWIRAIIDNHCEATGLKPGKVARP